jgi:hypothetical protein
MDLFGSIVEILLSGCAYFEFGIVAIRLRYLKTIRRQLICLYNKVYPSFKNASMKPCRSYIPIYLNFSYVSMDLKVLRLETQ